MLELKLGIVSDENTWRLLHTILTRLVFISKFELTVNKAVIELAGSSVPVYILGIGSRTTRNEPENLDALFVLSDIDDRIAKSLEVMMKSAGKVFVLESRGGDEHESTTDLIAFFLYELSKYLSLNKKFVEKALKSIDNEEVDELIKKFRLVGKSERI